MADNKFLSLISETSSLTFSKSSGINLRSASSLRKMDKLQRESIEEIIRAFDKYGDKDLNKLVYILGTARHESNKSSLRFCKILGWNANRFSFLDVLHQVVFFAPSQSALNMAYIIIVSRFFDFTLNGKVFKKARNKP